MNFKRPVYRKCAVTHESFLRSDLYKITRVNGEVYFDKNQNMHGRSCYIKKDLKVIELAHKKKIISKSLKLDVKDEIYLELIQELSKERR